MNSFVKVKTGLHRGKSVAGEVFPLLKNFKIGSRGGFITVDGTGQFNRPTIRVYVSSPADYEFVDGSEYTGVVHPVVEEPVIQTQTDEERIVEIAERFDILDQMTKATLNGDVRAMVVSGPPGVGKSFTVEQELERASLFDQVAGRKLRTTIVKGSASAIGLYKVLYQYSGENCVIVFDDCDAILFDEVALNLLKGALDTGKTRRISWLSESRTLRQEGIPDTFKFNGSVIFITNIKFDKVRSQRLRDHLEALQARCHYLDLTIDTKHDKFLRIKQIAGTGNLFSGYNFDKSVEDEIVDFMGENHTKLRDMNLHMAIKMAELRKGMPTTWKHVARKTCMI